MTVSINGSAGLTFNDGSAQNTSPFTGGFGFRNRIINGAMVIDQRNAGAASANSINAYFLDRWAVFQSTSGKVIAQQNAGSVTPPSGFTNYLGVTSQSAFSVASGDYYIIAQGIEGFNFADLAWGTASAATVTLSFWVYSSLTGTFGGSLRNGAANYSYPFTYTISAANTWEQKTITVAGPTAGTWIGATNALAMQINFGMGVGSTLSGTAGSWSASNFLSATGATSVVGTNGATFYITGVQLEKGSTATSFDYRPYGQELALCQRYYYKVVGTGTSSPLSIGFVESSTTAICATFFPVELRVKPTALEQTGTASNYRVRYGGGGATACSSVPSFWEATKTSAATLFTVASGLTSGQAAFGANNIADTPYLAWSAEL